MKINFEELHDTAMGLLVLAQQGNKCAEEQLIQLFMEGGYRFRVSKYLNKNRQVDNEDIKQEFVIGVALRIADVKMDIGDPIEYLVSGGVYRVRSYFRKMVIQNTIQICGDCGNKSRLNRVSDGRYQCKKCGSINVTPVELDDHNEFALENVREDGFEDDLVSGLLVEQFKATLTPGTNMYSLYEMLIEDGIDRDNPLVKNYISEIALRWGGTSNQNVVQNLKKLRKRLEQWLHSNSVEYNLS